MYITKLSLHIDLAQEKLTYLYLVQNIYLSVIGLVELVFQWTTAYLQTVITSHPGLINLSPMAYTVYSSTSFINHLELETICILIYWRIMLSQDRTCISFNFDNEISFNFDNEIIYFGNSLYCR